MKLSSLWKTQNKSSKFKALTILVPTSLLTAVMIFVTFYGKNTGNFSINVDDDAYKQNISISTSEKEDNNKKVLKVGSNPIMPIDSNSIVSLAKKIGNQDGGTHNDRNYISYTFYLKNESESLETEIMYYLTITESNDGKVDENFKMNSSIRMLVLDGDDIKVFKASESEGNKGDIDFVQGQTVIEQPSATLKAKEKRKYTLIMWYDLNEASKEDSIKPPQLKFQLNFKIRDRKS